MLVKHMIRELMKCPEDMEVYTCQDHDRDLSDLSIHYINNTLHFIGFILFPPILFSALEIPNAYFLGFLFIFFIM